VSAYKKLKETFKQLSHLTDMQSLLMWDEAVMMPEGAGEARASAMVTLNGLTQKILTSNKTKKLIALAKQETHLSNWDAMNLSWIEKKYSLSKCVPVKLNEKLTLETMRCEQAWRKLRAENNWKAFSPYLNKTFKIIKQIAERHADVLQMSPYDSQLDLFSPGFNQERIDSIFSGLKKSIPMLIQKIMQKQADFSTTAPVGYFPIESQKDIGLMAMRALRFDFQHGRLDVSHHPFCGGTPLDVRMTTRYKEDEFLSSLLGICHETGHGLYEQGLPSEWIEQPVGRVNSMAMHESQSLLIEMQVCRSLEFYEFLLPEISRHFGAQNAFTADNLYRLVTKVTPSFIRVDADEVTYPLHIILRYELEKSLFNGEITIYDLPARWDELLQKYLGLSTKNNDQDGVMQDVHWPSGAFGYFPAYTLGRLIAAQLFATFIKTHANFMENVQQGNFKLLRNWLHENIHSQASLLPTDNLLEKVTGEKLNPEYFIKHVEKRYLDE
jgi:carboxypeptidase Taq